MFNLGHFYFAQNRTFLLCLDNKKMREQSESAVAPAAPRMRVRCVSPNLHTESGCEAITVGSEFDVENFTDSFYLLEGFDFWIGAVHFEVISGAVETPVPDETQEGSK